MSLDTLGASLLGSMIAGEAVIRAGEGIITDGEGQNFYTASSFD